MFILLSPCLCSLTLNLGSNFLDYNKELLIQLSKGVRRLKNLRTLNLSLEYNDLQDKLRFFEIPASECIFLKSVSLNLSENEL